MTRINGATVCASSCRSFTMFGTTCIQRAWDQQITKRWLACSRSTISAAQKNWWWWQTASRWTGLSYYQKVVRCRQQEPPFLALIWSPSDKRVAEPGLGKYYAINFSHLRQLLPVWFPAPIIREY